MTRWFERSATLQSLGTRNFRLFFYGQVVSVSGSWMQTIALGWLVLDLTGSATALGAVLAVQSAPILIGGLFGGVVADRFNKRKALIAANTASAAVAVSMTVIAASGFAEVWNVMALAFLSGCVMVVEVPTRQAFVSEMVGAEQLPNAIALNAAMFNTGRLLGPALGGLIINQVGTPLCFAINAVSFAAIVVSLVLMNTRELHPSVPVPRGKGQIRDALRYAWRTPALRDRLWLLAIVTVAGLNQLVLIPLIVRDEFGAGAGTFGFLTAAMGLGAVFGALYLARRNSPSSVIRLGACLAFGLTIVATAFAPNAIACAALLVLSGFAMLLFMSNTNAGIQLACDPQYRGRVMALFALIVLGSAPIGGPLSGWMADQIGPRPTMAIGGFIVLGGASLATLRYRSNRPTPAAPTAPIGAPGAPAVSSGAPATPTVSSGAPDSADATSPHLSPA